MILVILKFGWKVPVDWENFHRYKFWNRICYKCIVWFIEIFYLILHKILDSF